MQGFLVMVMVVMVTGAAVQGPKCGFPCPGNYDPVCGSDGETYGNACALESARNCTDSDLTVAHQGECEGTTPECPYSCTYEYVPVCGSDGKTYPNMCVLNMTQACYDSDLTLAHEGECVTTVPDCPVICSTNYDPVCGTDGNTYGNVCALEGENKCYNSDLSFAHKGECDTECAYACPDNYDPVCGSDSVTYPNMCMLSVTQTCYDSELTLAHEGECVTTGECPYGCSGQWDPMCGSDGQTYGNLCELNVTKTCYKPDLTLAHEGECVTTDTECPYACPDNYDPVCGSDGMTYPNLCYLNMINACYDSELTLDHEGECHRPTESDCPRGCSDNWDPVCGGDGNTYGNLCQLGAERDCNSQSDLTVAYEGECKTRKH